MQRHSLGQLSLFWILAGELHDQSKWGVGPWGEVGRYVRTIDPYQHPITVHSGSGRRGHKEDDVIISYDMVGGSHNPETAAGLGPGCGKKQEGVTMMKYANSPFAFQAVVFSLPAF